MRQRRFLILLSLYFGLMVYTQAAVRVPYFVVLPDGIEMNDYSDRLEKMGAVIRMRMPPNVLTFEADSSINIDDAGPTARVYRHVIALNELAAYGPLAQAAGIQWNREMVKTASTQGFRTAGTMRTQAAQSSLPSPTHVTVSVDGNRVHVTWDSLAGAASYLVQLSKNAAFTDKIQSVSMKSEADLPRLETPGNGTLYARVSAIDNELTGAWSAAVSASVGPFTAGTTGTGPVLSSPLDNSTSDGFTVILEWAGDPNKAYRQQVSEKSSFDSPVVDALVMGGEFAIPSSVLKIGKTYFWRVREWSPTGSDWSQTRQFTVAEPMHIENDAMLNPEAPR